MSNPKNNKKGNNNYKVHDIESSKSVSDDYSDCLFNINVLGSINDYPPNHINVKLNGISHKMKVDSGSLHSIISSNTYVRLWPVNSLSVLPVSVQYLRTWNAEKLNVNGYFDVNVKHNAENVTLLLLVLEGKGKSLIGRSWFDALKININVDDSNVHKIYVPTLD